jgi:hypothetical protein
MRAIVGVGGRLIVTMTLASTLADISLALAQQGVQATGIERKGSDTMPAHNFVGMWVTADGRVRHELLPNGRYDEARGGRKSAYQGRYEVRGNHIEYWDDTGFTADGNFIDGVLHHGGMVLRREGS